MRCYILHCKGSWSDEPSWDKFEGQFVADVPPQVVHNIQIKLDGTKIKYNDWADYLELLSFQIFCHSKPAVVSQPPAPLKLPVVPSASSHTQAINMTPKRRRSATWKSFPYDPMILYAVLWQKNFGISVLMRGLL